MRVCQSREMYLGGNLGSWFIFVAVCLLIVLPGLIFDGVRGLEIGLKLEGMRMQQVEGEV